MLITLVESRRAAFVGVVLTLVPVAEAAAQPSPPALSVPEDSGDRRHAERCLERLGQVPEAPNPDRAVAIAEGAARSCDRVGQRDERVDGAPFRAHQAAMLAWAQGQQNAARDAGAALVALDRALMEVGRRAIDTDWSSPADTARIEADVERLRADGAALRARLAVAPMAPPSFDAFRRIAVVEAGTVPRDLARLDALLDGTVHRDAAFNEALALSAHWEVAAMILPDEPAVTAARDAAAAWIARVGGREGAVAVQEEAIAARASRARFPRPADRDPGLESEMRRVFEAQGWDEPVRALAITSAWAEERDAGGRVIGRRRDAAIGVRLSNRTCRVYDFTFFQPRSGDGWGAMRRSSHASTPIACGNLPR